MNAREERFYKWLGQQLTQQNYSERIAERVSIKAEHRAKADTYRFVMDQFQKHFAGE